MGKRKRGECEFVSEKKNNMLILSWNDRRVVNVASNGHSANPVGHCDRYSKSDRKRIAISRPNVIKQYNKYMGFTDLMDQNVNRYRVHIRNKKWYFSIFTWLIDVAIQNAWCLLRQTGGNMTSLRFRRRIAMSYLQRFGKPPKKPGRPASREVGTSGGDSRYDGIMHFIQHTASGKRRRCVRYACNSVIKSECQKCNVGLCVSCFSSFHTK